MPEWLPDLNKLGSLSSILGLIVTLFLLYEARKIRNSFLRRARLPEVNRELLKSTSQLSENLKDWSTDKNSSLETFSTIEALLENVRGKLPSDEKGKVDDYLSNLHPRKWWFLNSPLSELTEDEAWSRYTDLSGLVTRLQQLAKDSKWD